MNYAPEQFGIGPYATELAEYLASEGHAVSVVTAVPHYPGWSTYPGYIQRGRRTSLENGVLVTRIGLSPRTPMTAMNRGLLELEFAMQALRELPKQSPEVVVSFTPGLASGLLITYPFRHNPRRILVVEDLLGEGLRQSSAGGHRLLSWAVRHLEAIALRRSDTTIAISDRFVPHLEALGARPSNIVVLSNWLKQSELGILKHGSPAESKSSSACPRVIHTGSMGPKQGLDQLIRAAALADMHSTQFVLVGDGPEKAHLQQMAAELHNVEFRTPVSAAEYPQLLASADVLAVCQAPHNIDMSFPSKLMSYLAAGRPIVASVPSSGPVASFIRRAGVGCSVEPNSPEALARAIRSVTSSPDFVAKFGRESIAAVQRFLPDRALPQWRSAILGIGKPRPQNDTRNKSDEDLLG